MLERAIEGLAFPARGEDRALQSLGETGSGAEQKGDGSRRALAQYQQNAQQQGSEDKDSGCEGGWAGKTCEG